ncbi:MAG TPA: sugar phosphate isomerase/epimerase [Fimbriimonadaceae bacterium]|nr:sugar phosphate isomerase/epimerase [Fimbriimonadaceae bacterium]
MLLAVQLYTVRDLLQKDFSGTLKALKSMGVEYIEGASGYDRKPEEWKDLMGELGFRVVGGHVGLEALVRNPIGVAAEAKLLGYDCVIVPWASGKNYPGGWKAFAEILNLLSGQLKAAGVVGGYHNHNHEMELENGTPGLDIIFANTDPNLVKAQIDVGWVNFGGGDPVSYIRKYGSRLNSVHLKDSVRGPEHIDVVAGTGQVDWDGVAAACFEVGCKYGALEMDNPPGDALKSVEKSLDFYRSKGIGK